MNNQEIDLLLAIIQNGSYAGTAIDEVHDLKIKLLGMKTQVPTNIPAPEAPTA